MLKPILAYLAEATDLLNQLLNLGLFNIHKMRVPNGHVVFSSKNNFQELQLLQALIFFSEF